MYHQDFIVAIVSNSVYALFQDDRAKTKSFWSNICAIPRRASCQRNTRLSVKRSGKFHKMASCSIVLILGDPVAVCRGGTKRSGAKSGLATIYKVNLWTVAIPICRWFLRSVPNNCPCVFENGVLLSSSSSHADRKCCWKSRLNWCIGFAPSRRKIYTFSRPPRGLYIDYYMLRAWYPFYS